MIDRMGVMPLPPAMPTWLRRACGSIGTKKRPCGGMTLMVSPGLRCSLIQLENTPPRTLRTPTRNSPSSTPAQIEYERRRSWPSMSLRSVRYWPWVKPKTGCRSSGTSKDTTTASGVSGWIARTRSGWNRGVFIVLPLSCQAGPGVQRLCLDHDRTGLRVKPAMTRLGVHKGLKYSNGSLQSRQRCRDLHAVDPKADVRSVCTLPQRGQAMADWRRTMRIGEAPSGSVGPGGAMP